MQQALEEKGQEGLDTVPEKGWGSGVRECAFEQHLGERREPGFRTWWRKVLQAEETAGPESPREGARRQRVRCSLQAAAQAALPGPGEQQAGI